MPAAAAPTKIGIVIPVYNRRETTLRGLRSLARADRTGLDVRVFVVDDASPDGTAEAVEAEFPDVVVIRGTGSLHYAAGTNRGIEAALAWGADYVAPMNDDAVFHEQFLVRMLAAAETGGQRRTVVGAMLLLWDEPHKVFQVDFKWRTLGGGWTLPPQDRSIFDYPRETFEVEGMAGNCLLVPAEAIRACGMLDETRFPHGWGDIQWLVRLRRSGWRLVVEPRAYVWCEPNTYPRPLHRETAGRAAGILFRDRRHPLNLQRQFIARWESAPGRAAAVASFAVYLLTLSGKAVTSAFRRPATDRS